MAGRIDNPARESLVSVIIPTRNRRDLLLRAVNSVRAQTHQNWELIIVDQGSIDGSQTAIENLREPRIRWIQNDQSTGVASNRRVGAMASKGEYVAFLDSDDLWLVRHLQKSIESIQSAPQDEPYDGCESPPVSYDGVRCYIPNAPHRPDGVALADFLYVRRGYAALSSGIVLRGRVAREITFNASLSVNQDTDYLLRLEQASKRILFRVEPSWVHDVSPRQDRVSRTADNCHKSLVWFDSVSSTWSPQAKRGFLFWDAALRNARAGRRMNALRFWIKGLPAAGSVRTALYQLGRVVFGGEWPLTLRRAWAGFVSKPSELTLDHVLEPYKDLEAPRRHEHIP